MYAARGSILAYTYNAMKKFQKVRFVIVTKGLYYMNKSGERGRGGQDGGRNPFTYVTGKK